MTALEKSFLYSSNDLKSTIFSVTLYYSADCGLNVWPKIILSFCLANYLYVSKSLSSDEDPKKITTGAFDTFVKNVSKSSTEFNSVDGGPFFFKIQLTISF